MAKCYVAEHIKADGRYKFGIAEEKSKLDYGKADIHFPLQSLKLYKTRLNSHHSATVKYFIFVLINTEKERLELIEEHYCICKVGKQIIGCCSHIAS